jgi:hypothetical protein
MIKPAPTLNGDKDKLVNSAILTVVARFAMISAAGALPIAGWMFQRGISTVDEVSRKIDAVRDLAIETGVTVKLIQQAQQIQGSIMTDHEGRIRLLEGKRPLPK